MNDQTEKSFNGFIPYNVPRRLSRQKLTNCLEAGVKPPFKNIREALRLAPFIPLLSFSARTSEGSVEIFRAVKKFIEGD